MMRICFDPAARAEFSAAVSYYEEQQIGLGSRFLAAVESTTSRIRRTPFLHRLIEEDVRKIRVRRFPYAVIYRAREQVIEIIAVMHLRRRPGYWRTRGG